MGCAREMTQEEKIWQGVILGTISIDKLLWHRGGRIENADFATENLNEYLAVIEEKCRQLRGKINKSEPEISTPNQPLTMEG